MTIKVGQPDGWVNHPLKPGLPPLPPQIADLPVAKNGYPVPWFVEWLPSGEPEFRGADSRKFILALQERRCWVCGRGIPPGPVAFIVGPMCTVNRISAEPPSHKECALFSLKACPFLIKPHMVRRENDIPEEQRDPPGGFIKRNPGVTALWITSVYHAFRHEKGALVEIGKPYEVQWFTEGREATRVEVERAFNTGCPLLRELCNQEKESERAADHAELDQKIEEAKKLFPADLPGAPDGGAEADSAKLNPSTPRA